MIFTITLLFNSLINLVNQICCFINSFLKLKMILKFILISLVVKAVFCEAAYPLEVNCPDGWLAQDLAIYSEKRIDEIQSKEKRIDEKQSKEKRIDEIQLKDKNNFTICLICQRNSILKSHPFRFVEICFFNLQRLKSTQLDVTSCDALLSCDAESLCDAISSTLKKYQSDNCKALKTNPYAGIKFNFTSNETSLNDTLGRLKLAPFEKSEFVLSNSNSVNLSCPSQSSLLEVQKREVFVFNSTKETSLCVICQLKSQNNNSTGKNISICSSHFCPFGNKTFLFTEHKLRNCTNCTIEEGTGIKSAQFCGYSFQSSKLTNLSVTNYTLCEEPK
jgi:hypothetical protein